jgi:glycosyltransferase involved in cell wall biosynthesis
VAFIDHDDVWAPDKLERQVEVFESRPEVGLLYSNCAFVNAAGHRIGPYLTAQRMHRGRVLPELLLDCFVPLLTAVVRRDVIDGVGLFNSRWGIAEDYDFFLRVAERHEFDFVPDMLGGYRLHSNNTSSDVTRLRREESEVLEIALSRRPEMMGELGQRAVRMRLAGVRMGRDQALVLAGRGRELAALGLPPMSPARRSKAVLAYLVALMGPRAVIRLERYYGRIRKALGKPGMETRLPEHAAPDTV